MSSGNVAALLVIVIAMFTEILRRISHLTERQASMQNNAAQINAAIEELTVTVAAQSDVIDSAVAAFNGVAAQLEDFKDDPAAISAIAAKLRTDSARLAAAIPANTPAQGVTTTQPAPNPDPAPAETPSA